MRKISSFITIMLTSGAINPAWNQDSKQYAVQNELLSALNGIPNKEELAVFLIVVSSAIGFIIATSIYCKRKASAPKEPQVEENYKQRA
jgi:hypothetical protein